MGKCPEIYHKSRRNHSRRGEMSLKAPQIQDKSRQADWKCPGKCRKTVRNHGCRGEMSWKTPQNREKPRQRQRNVPKNATNPGETTAVDGKCPGKRHKFRRNHGRRGEMSRKQPQFQEKFPVGKKIWGKWRKNLVNCAIIITFARSKFF